MFVCPICKAKFENLNDYTKHINDENAKSKKSEQKAIDAEKKALVDKIDIKYNELKNLINEFNKKYTKEYYVSELKHVNKRDINFPELSAASDDEVVDLFVKALFGE